ncbi:MAG TPA: rhodanese-like domain-containing protein [Gemmatimonadales bacterium]|nr:rhodanese-like domain-containing protein [Gemmatimonadales bacterium]
MSELFDAVSDLLNACEPVPGLVTGGQPQESHLAALKRAGCDVVLDVRDPMEAQPFRAPDAVRGAGLEYRNIVVGHSPGDDATLAAMRQAMRELLPARRVFCYCNSGNRVAAALIPYLMLDRKLDEEAAVELAMKMGMRDAGLMEWGVEYARKEAERQRG